MILAAGYHFVSGEGHYVYNLHIPDILLAPILGRMIGITN
jgi:hypothetical protein